MRTADLEAEWRAAQDAMSKSDAIELLASRFPKGVIMHMIGIARIRLTGAGYEPDPTGQWAHISPARSAGQLTEHTYRDWRWEVLDGDLVDLVAWVGGSPHAWASRTGAAEWLGCIPLNEPTYIRRSPVSWLRNKCHGLVLLATDRVRQYEILSDCDEIIAEDEYHAAQLSEALVYPYPSQRVLVA